MAGNPALSDQMIAAFDREEELSWVKTPGASIARDVLSDRGVLLAGVEAASGWRPCLEMSLEAGRSDKAPRGLRIKALFSRSLMEQGGWKNLVPVFGLGSEAWVQGVPINLKPLRAERWTVLDLPLKTEEGAPLTVTDEERLHSLSLYLNSEKVLAGEICLADLELLFE
jgi:hypothetical protein